MNSTPRINFNGIRRTIEPSSDGLEGMRNLIRYRAQSILSVDGQAGPLLPYPQAQDIVAWHQRHVAQQARHGLGWGYIAHVPSHIRGRLFWFTTGSANPLHLHTRDRRFSVVGA